jgi:hypothetical protein
MAHDRRSILGVLSALTANALQPGDSRARSVVSVEALLAANRNIDKALPLQQSRKIGIHSSARQIDLVWDAVRESWHSVELRVAQVRPVQVFRGERSC